MAESNSLALQIDCNVHILLKNNLRCQVLRAELWSEFWPNCDGRDLGRFSDGWPNCPNFGERCLKFEW